MRACEWCNESIDHRDVRARYCDMSCVEKARYARDGEKRRAAVREYHRTYVKLRAETTRVCAHCDTEFNPPKDTRPSLFCSRPCYDDSRKATTAARTEKPCSKCGTVKPLEDFPSGSGTDGLRSNCKPCDRAAHRAYIIRKNYGITLEQYEEMFAAQGSCCAICGTTETFNNRAFPVDHDHKTGAVRGILCGPCNLGIGQLGDDAGRLIAAAMYLLSHAEGLVRHG